MASTEDFDESTGAYPGTADTIGAAITAMLKQAAQAVRNQQERSTRTCNNLQEQVRQSEERIRQLEAEVKQFQERALRAEKWLTHIQSDIEGLLAKMHAEWRRQND